MNPSEIGFEGLSYDLTADLLYGGLVVGISALAIYLLGTFVLRRLREKIAWSLLKLYYGIATPTFLILLGMSEQLSQNLTLQSIASFGLMLIGPSMIPLVPIFLVGAMLPLPLSNPWLYACFLLPTGHLLGRAFVFLLYWLAWSDEASKLNLRSKG